MSCIVPKIYSFSRSCWVVTVAFWHVCFKRLDRYACFVISQHLRYITLHNKLFLVWLRCRVFVTNYYQRQYELNRGLIRHLRQRQLYARFSVHWPPKLGSYSMPREQVVVGSAHKLLAWVCSFILASPELCTAIACFQENCKITECDVRYTLMQMNYQLY
jgi:hypothetical protein